MELAIWLVDSAGEIDEMLQEGFTSITQAQAAAQYAIDDGDVPEGYHVEAWFMENGELVGTKPAEVYA